MEYDKQLVQHQKQQQEGKMGHIPWGTGFSNNKGTSSSMIGSYYNRR